MAAAVAAIYAHVGKRLQSLRKAHGLTQNQLAERADVAVSYLVKLEGGVRKARLEVLERIAKALGEPLWRLFADSRLTAEEERWQGQARELARIVGDLGEDDVRALIAVAAQLAGRRGVAAAAVMDSGPSGKYGERPRASGASSSKKRPRGPK